MLGDSPAAVAAWLSTNGRAAHIIRDPATGELVASHAELGPLKQLLETDTRDSYAHEGVYLESGRRTGALLAAFVHWTTRGQAAGGLRHWPYATFESLVRDGLRLSRGMTRKNALAGLWWGGGKGIVAATDRSRDPAWRQAVYADYGDFMTRIRGVYITAEDVGTTLADMAHVFGRTRFVTCVPPEQGGSGNPSRMTAHGVVCAMEGALAELGRGELTGKRVVMQGAGNVATFMMQRLLDRGVGSILATDIDGERLAEVGEQITDERLELKQVGRDDLSVFSERCDIFAPNALGGVLNEDTIPLLNTDLVCGAANNQLLDAEADAKRLAERGIPYVPDFLANRMGIVNCADEHVGSIPNDPTILRHLGREWDNAVYVVTRRVLARARDEGIHTAAAANALADELARVPNPIWPGRGEQIAASLLRG